MNKFLIFIFFFFLFTGCGNLHYKICPEEKPFCFERGDLQWSGITENTMDWSSSIEYCEELGGRLPSFSELRTLLIKCPEAQMLNTCPVDDDCLSLSCWEDPCAGCKWDVSGKYSRFDDTECFWTLSEDSEDSNYAWTINFVNSYVGNMKKSEMNFVRCVRKD